MVNSRKILCHFIRHRGSFSPSVFHYNIKEIGSPAEENPISIYYNSLSLKLRKQSQTDVFSTFDANNMLDDMIGIITAAESA